ncbi:hypothetical protein BDW66DRAFT_146498, partial [Aspergillus desertorum]
MIEHWYLPLYWSFTIVYSSLISRLSFLVLEPGSPLPSLCLLFVPKPRLRNIIRTAYGVDTTSSLQG